MCECSIRRNDYNDGPSINACNNVKIYCFPGRAKLAIKNGIAIQMKDVNRPVPVKSWKISKKAGGVNSLSPDQIVLEDDKVLTFLHAGKGMTQFIQIWSEDANDCLEISQNHLVFCKDANGLRFKLSKELVVGEFLVK